MNMNVFKKLLPLSIVSMLLTWAAYAFTLIQPNPTTWTEGQRVDSIFVAIIVGLALHFIEVVSE